jgi:hypothetical protein
MRDYCFIWPGSVCILLFIIISAGCTTPVVFGLLVEYFEQEGFTESRCQRNVKPPTWRTSDLERSNCRHRRALLAEGTMAENFVHVTFGFFYMP